MTYPARFYAALHRGTPGDLAHYQRVCRGARSILELGCGYGRVLATLADPERHLMVGVDLDPEFIAMARDTIASLPPELRRNVRLVKGDLRSITLETRFERVLLPFGALWCVLGDADLDRALATAASHLTPDGILAFDVYRADEFHHEAEPDDVPDDAHTPIGRVEIDGIAYEVLERSTWDQARQRIDVSYLYIDEQGRTVEGTIAQHYRLEDQLRAALARAGLTVTRMDDGFDRGELDDGEPQELMVVEATLSPKAGERDGRAGS